jgi:16S rRNA (uracil1498-N3)-methyltransferase
MQRITLNPSQIDDSNITLTTEQHHYLTRVIRLHNGSQFQAIDGTGNVYLAKITNDTAQIIQLISTDSQKLDRSVILICALPKGNNFDDLVRACTELGVTEIMPALSDRTLLQPSPQKLQRWRKIAQEATEQSERSFVPTIDEPRAMKAIFDRIPAVAHKYICEARGEHSHLLTCLQSTPITEPIILAIGPEGGWTDGELDRAIKAGFQPVSLGRRILRTITAPIVALSIVAAVTEQIPVPKC